MFSSTVLLGNNNYQSEITRFLRIFRVFRGQSILTYDTPQRFKKSGKRNIGTFSSGDLCFAGREKSGDREGHRDPVVAMWIDPRTCKVGPFDPKSVGKL